MKNGRSCSLGRPGTSKLTLCLALIFLLCGCGEPKVEAPLVVTSVAPPTPTPLPEPTATPEPVEVDFASLDAFPDLEFDFSGTLSGENTRAVPVLDLVDATEEQAWWGGAPATFELTLPAGASVHRIEVESTEGSSAFLECVVFLRGANETEWRRPSGLVLDQTMGDFVEKKGYRLRHVYVFDETPADQALIGVAAAAKNPDRVGIRDIDVLGYLKN